MANNVKKVILKKKIGNVLYDLYVKTHADIVVVDEDGTTLATKITELVSAIAGKATGADIDARINQLVNGAPEAFDTLKEIADYIATHEDVVTALNKAIGNKVEKEAGKGLSTNDFTNELKAKLENLQNFSGSADDITETTNRKFVTEAEKNKIENSARVIIAKSQPTDLTSNDLWCEDITV